MTATAQTILDAFFAFRTRQIQRSTWNRTLRQMTELPEHLIDDIDPHARVAEERSRSGPTVQQR